MSYMYVIMNSFLYLHKLFLHLIYCDLRNHANEIELVI